MIPKLKQAATRMSLRSRGSFDCFRSGQESQKVGSDHDFVRIHRNEGKVRRGRALVKPPPQGVEKFRWTRVVCFHFNSYCRLSVSQLTNSRRPASIGVEEWLLKGALNELPSNNRSYHSRLLYRLWPFIYMYLDSNWCGSLYRLSTSRIVWPAFTSGRCGRSLRDRWVAEVEITRLIQLL